MQEDLQIGGKVGCLPFPFGRGVGCRLQGVSGSVLGMGSYVGGGGGMTGRTGSGYCFRMVRFTGRGMSSKGQLAGGTHFNGTPGPFAGAFNGLTGPVVP